MRSAAQATAEERELSRENWLSNSENDRRGDRCQQCYRATHRCFENLLLLPLKLPVITECESIQLDLESGLVHNHEPRLKPLSRSTHCDDGQSADADRPATSQSPGASARVACTIAATFSAGMDGLQLRPLAHPAEAPQLSPANRSTDAAPVRQPLPRIASAWLPVGQADGPAGYRASPTVTPKRSRAAEALCAFSL